MYAYLEMADHNQKSDSVISMRTLLEEQSRKVSSRSDLKQTTEPALGFLKSDPNNNSKMSNDIWDQFLIRKLVPKKS